MVSIEDIKAIDLFADLTEQMLEKICPMTELRQFEEREVIYEEGERADNFYLLKRGKILLEVEISEMIIISLSSIKSGYSFGWGALLPGSSYTSYAVCSEPCEVFTLPAKKFLKLLDEDHTMGYRVMTEVAAILKNRLVRRTDQYLKVMSKHPDIQKLLGL